MQFTVIEWYFIITIIPYVNLSSNLIGSPHSLHDKLILLFYHLRIWYSECPRR